MSNQSTIDTVRAIASEQLGVEIETIHEESRFMEDLGADSLDAAELVMSIEEQFEITIPDEDAETLTTISKAATYIDEHKK